MGDRSGEGFFIGDVGYVTDDAVPEVAAISTAARSSGSIPAGSMSGALPWLEQVCLRWVYRRPELVPQCIGE